MHNRARMVVHVVPRPRPRHRLADRSPAPSSTGLVDGDIASKFGGLGSGWQAPARTPRPYFRIFNPVRQSQKFDPTGVYIRQFVPELAEVPATWIHAPWMAPPLELASVGVTLDDSYPYPIVDHAAARDRTLAAYAAAATRAARR